MSSRMLTLAFPLLLMSSAAAQTATQTPRSAPAASADVTIVQVIAGMAKPGSEAQYVEGRKRHVEWHRAQKDAWNWHAYDVISGDAAGSVVTVTSPHKWADQDTREQFTRDDFADVQRNIAPYAMPHVISYWRVRSDMGRAGAPKAEDPPAPYYTVQHFLIEPEDGPTYIENIKRASAAQDKVNVAGPKGIWYQLVNGGEGPHFVLVTPRKNWAEFQGPLIDDTLREALGAQGATLIGNIRKAMRKTWTEILQHNQELSYHAAGGAATK
jgi:hypothetical protein